jgi:AbrB family looped-hinge helix DNA binding protein
MKEKINIKITDRGVFTLPKKIREKYKLKTGDNITLLDLDGVFLITPRISEIDAYADRLTDAMKERGETLDTMLQSLREERLKYEKKV